MHIPEGEIVDPETKQKFIWKLENSLYGLKASPKKWSDRFSTVMLNLGLDSNHIDPCLLFKKTREKTVLMLLYVDDILVASEYA